MYKSPKTRKGKYKVYTWAAISSNGRSDIELFTSNMDYDFYWEVLKRIIKSLKNWKNKNYSTMRQCFISCLLKSFRVLWEELDWENRMAS